jgi:hypothetical protein
MSRTIIEVLEPILSGINLRMNDADVANGNCFKWPGVPCMIVARNTGGAPITLTVVTPLAINDLTVDELSVSIPATNGEKVMAIMEPRAFVNSDGYIYLNASGALKVAVFKLSGSSNFGQAWTVGSSAVGGYDSIS